MKYRFAAAALAMSVLPALALQLAPISPHQALANRGQCVSIEGTASVRSDPQRPGLDVDLDGKDSSAFGYILPQNQSQFPDISSMDGQRVAITGVVTMYLGRAQIHMTSARQLAPAGGNSDSGLTNVGPEWAKGDQNTACGA
ncbi:MAG TPA: hypothetical protein VNW15_14305 [Rhizomicrobium sp.]|nr:hypothetical protein [Rhizomicrobium sp.]